MVCMVFAPVKESLCRVHIRHPGITIANGRGKKFDEGAAGERWVTAYAICLDDRR